VIGLKKFTKLHQDEFSLGITRGFRFLSDLFLVTNTITSLDLSDFRTLWGKRVTGESGSFGRTNS
jgi:hypothetical protein